MTTIETHMTDLDNGVSFIKTEFKSLRKRIDSLESNSVPRVDFDSVAKEVIDLSNQNRRNNFCDI